MTSGTHRRRSETAIGMGYVRADLAEPGTELEIDVRGKRRAARGSRSARSTPRDRIGFAAVADASYPEDLSYHAEHDWARIEGDDATFGITWYAQDALGEVVFFEPPEVGTTVSKDAAYAEVESVKAVSDVYRAAVRRDHRGQLGAEENPEMINERSLRRGLDGQGEALGPLRGRRA